MPALFYLMRVQTDRWTDKQTYIQTGWGMVSGRPKFASSLFCRFWERESGTGSGGISGAGRAFKSNRYIGPVEPENICVSAVERYHCGNANKNIIPLSITLGSNHS